ncbi:DUF4333 domain-containing protein [Mycolicibacterium sediminis]|uniref:DUF4333 domain-containing protein n=1 Tax=Mycolicibacterium sediminis TaxID=1286180 RepID=A0A7I7QY58_9MYCO|nr:DUF4333 domain-containing protein [Mycolicibacterium sediminis]BBY31284.1 hypothetical protein MSEDJ_53800 [Mycolicibacterium sediminis]
MTGERHLASLRVRIVGICVMPAVCVAVTSCNVHFSTRAGSPTAPSGATTKSVIPKDVVEERTSQSIRDQSGGGPVVVECPGDLPLRSKASQSCVLSQDGKRFRVTVTVNDANPSKYDVDWEVGEQLDQGA